VWWRSENLPENAPGDFDLKTHELELNNKTRRRLGARSQGTCILMREIISHINAKNTQHQDA